MLQRILKNLPRRLRAIGKKVSLPQQLKLSNPNGDFLMLGSAVVSRQKIQLIFKVVVIESKFSAFYMVAL
jgi:hypothetical protein